MAKSAVKRKKQRQNQAKKAKLVPGLKKDKKKLKKKLKKTRQKSQPLAKRFTKKVGGFHRLAAIIFVGVVILGVLGWIFREQGPKVTVTLIVGSFLLGLAAWAFQSVANPNNHKK